jgi:hypothetical protein
VGADITATTDEGGKYVLQVPRSAVRAEQIQVKVEAEGLQSKVTSVVATAPTLTVNVALGLGFTEQITVGSRAAGAEAEKAVPVDVISHEQIAASGYAETTQLIESMVPSFNFPRPTITDGTDTVRPATLRGLGPDQVLVLINGKRRLFRTNLTPLVGPDLRRSRTNLAAQGPGVTNSTVEECLLGTSRGARGPRWDPRRPRRLLRTRDSEDK